MTYNQAVTRANSLDRKNHKSYYVVLSDTPEVDGVYTVADDFDLDTWFQGISESRVLYCSADR